VEFDCHINLEMCASVKAVKYIHKYIYKGPDRATIQTDGPQDEIRSYLDARYISSTQACHNIFEFPMHMEYPAVYRLPVHLPGQNTVVFRPEDDIEDVVNNVKDSPLLGWFKANADPELVAAGAHNHLYQDFPKRFVWNRSRGKWKVRQRYQAIGRMYSIPVTAGECFYLRVLLTTVKGMSYYINFKLRVGLACSLA